MGIQMQVAKSTKIGNERQTSIRKEELLIGVHLVAVVMTAFLTSADVGIVSLPLVSNTIVSIVVFLAVGSVFVIPTVIGLFVLTSKRSAKDKLSLGVVESIVLAVHLAWLFPAVS